jgi:hypothetical protein
MEDSEYIDESASTGAGPIFPLSRVKKIMKADKDVHMCSADAVMLTTMAAVTSNVSLDVAFTLLYRRIFWSTSARPCVEWQNKIEKKRWLIKMLVILGSFPPPPYSCS